MKFEMKDETTLDDLFQNFSTDGWTGDAECLGPSELRSLLLANFDIRNPSWPKLKWKLAYIVSSDEWDITTDAGIFVARIKQTLVAYAFVRINNMLVGVGGQAA